MKNYVDQSEIDEVCRSQSFNRFRNLRLPLIQRAKAYVTNTPILLPNPSLEDVADYFNSYFIEDHSVDVNGIYWTDVKGMGICWDNM